MNELLKKRLTLIAIGAILFNYLFWNESHGINILIFSIFILIANYINGLKFRNKILSFSLSSGFFITSLAIAYHGSSFAIIMYYISMFLLIGYVQQAELKSIVYIAASAIVASIQSLILFFKNIPLSQANNKKIKRIFKIIKLSLIPIIILFVFYLIFINANPEFEKLANHTMNFLSKKLAFLFKLISFQRFLFFLFGLVVNIWILYKTNLPNLVIAEALRKEELIRKKVSKMLTNIEYFKNLKEKSPEYYRIKFAFSLKLKYEYISALFLLVLVNLLLFIVNVIDIKWVWFGFKYTETFNLKQFVHEGTYLLIISILLSIGIMLYFFRKNLNFYPKTQLIKNLAYTWIAQNIILTISVALRNFHYITYWGLAYKRIGVILFLIAVAYGLLTLFIKIRKNKSSFYLIKRNSYAIYVLLILASLINWDVVIAKHNLQHPFENHMETSYLLSLSDKILPMIDQKQNILLQNTKFNTYSDYSPYSYKEYYQKRVNIFIGKSKKANWLSWNYNDWQAYQYYKNRTIK